jgi:hypothetical protein
LLTSKFLSIMTFYLSLCYSFFSAAHWLQFFLPYRNWAQKHIGLNRRNEKKWQDIYAYMQGVWLCWTTNENLRSCFAWTSLFVCTKVNSVDGEVKHAFGNCYLQHVYVHINISLNCAVTLFNNMFQQLLVLIWRR